MNRARHGLHGTDRERSCRKRGEGVGVRVSRDELRGGGGEGEEGHPRGLHPPGVGVETLGHLPGEEIG